MAWSTLCLGKTHSALNLGWMCLTQRLVACSGHSLEKYDLGLTFMKNVDKTRRFFKEKHIPNFLFYRGLKYGLILLNIKPK